MDTDNPAPTDAAHYRPVSGAKLSPTSGQLFLTSHPVSHRTLLAAVEKRCLRHPLPVRPKLAGFLPFDVPDADSGLPVDHMLSNGRLSVLRHACITRNIPAAALARAQQKALDVARRTSKGQALSEQQAMDVKGGVYSDLLAGAFVDEKEAPIYYLHDSGFVFVAQRSQNLANEGASLVDQVLEEHASKPFKFATRCADVLSRWLLEATPPADFEFGESALLVGSDKAKAKFDRHDLTSKEVVDHLHAGLQVIELQLIHRERVTFTLTQTGFIKGIALAETAPIEDVDGVSAQLVQALHYARTVFPAIAAALQAVGGGFGAAPSAPLDDDVDLEVAA